MNGTQPPPYQQSDFLQTFQDIMPTGPIWPRDPDAVLTQTINALMPTYVRQYDRSTNLLIDAFPATTVELLPEWEATLGLPDPCTVASPSLEQRQAAVVAKLISGGGQSAAYFVAFAAALGFAITIDQYWPFDADDPCDGPCYDEGWQFFWQVNAPDVTTFYFSADQSFADDPLETYDATELVCRISILAPAQTTVAFVFSS
jgi:uncharacterized protein YmfQ (DUF2313 family)